MDLVRSAQFACPAGGTEDGSVPDTELRLGRHLNRFQSACYIQARQPRVNVSELQRENRSGPAGLHSSQDVQACLETVTGFGVDETRRGACRAHSVP